MIAVVFALKFEGAAFLGSTKYETWTLGITGATAAKELARKLDSSSPSMVVSAGFGGGLQPELKVGDLVIGQNHSDPDLLARLEISEKWRQGSIFTAEKVVESPIEKRRLGRETGALVVDMETAHLAALCRERGIPVLCLRCVSDAVDHAMPVPARFLLNPETGKPQPFPLIGYLATHPAAIGGFCQLVRNARQAQANLASGLSELLVRLGE